VMEPDPPEETGVAKYQRALRLLKNKMVVLISPGAGRLDAQFSSHAEVESEPIAAREFEKHLFSPRLRPQKTAAGELADDRARIGSAKNPLLPVKLHPLDFLSKSRVPLPAKIFHLCELRHELASPEGRACARPVFGRR
jgi:hypothetical protein